MLDVFKSNGPLMAYLQKSTLHSIAPAITKLFNMSIASGKLPKDWKSSVVVPIPKKGDHSDPSNYCPISLLPVLSISQWGFLPGRSTTDAVLSATHEWHQTLYSGSEVCSIFFKAFDSVPHRSLIAKLSLLNISDFYSSESLTT